MKSRWLTDHDSQVTGVGVPGSSDPLATQHYMLLQRNLIYTGITRGKRLLVLIDRRRRGHPVRNDVHRGGIRGCLPA